MANMTLADELMRDFSPQVGTLKKIMVCNRGEIAVRVIRAGKELGLETVAIYSSEDKFSMHRSKADEAYEITALEGDPPLTPVGAYLYCAGILHIAKEAQVDVIHPGYGFLSENAEFAQQVIDAGIQWCGPLPEHIHNLGDKTKAREVAMAAGVQIVPGSDGPLKSGTELEAFVATNGLPVIIKAAMGGGGRGMRIVNKQSELLEAFERCVSEAENAFGDGTVFVERYIQDPKHIEVQVLGDNHGHLVHLFERDCSVQRRHQKVIEIAPAVHTPQATRQALQKDAVALCRHLGYRNAGTVEFLVDHLGRHYFIEVNPRIQVEHTVTEEITGIDIVGAQICVAGGATLESLGIKQESIRYTGCAIQCRVTTEDSRNGFVPDIGKIEVYRTGAGNGVRLDGGPGYSGAVIQPFFDSLLVKVTVRGPTWRMATRKMERVLSEFRVRGVKTNISFLRALLTTTDFLQGEIHTRYIDTKSINYVEDAKEENNAHKLLKYLAEVVVNGPTIAGMVKKPEGHQITEPAPLPVMRNPPPPGWRQVLLEKGPAAFAQTVRAHKVPLLMDTTWRDAHQSLLMTRMRTIDIERVAPLTANNFSGLFALEMWGGATFDVSYRFLKECPWDRLRALRDRVPNIPFSMLLRGANAVGYTSYADNVVFEFVKHAKNCGVDIFRVFDSLNYLDNLKLGIDAIHACGGVVEAAVCYTGNVADPTDHPKYTVEYYLDLVDSLVAYGIHILCIKDMAGLLRPKAARLLVGSIRAKHPLLPIHVHTHDTAGAGVASMLACYAAGADVVDAAVDSMSGLTSQPSMGAIIHEIEGTGVTPQQLAPISTYWGQIRKLYDCFDPGLRSGTSDIYRTEMPGGQYTNLQFQAASLGLDGQWEAVTEAYVEANHIMGDIVKVTPSSKVVGDLAQFMVQNNIKTREQFKAEVGKYSLPRSVVEYFQGYLGIPPGGFDNQLREAIVRNLPCIEGRPGASMEPIDFEALKKQLTDKHGGWIEFEHAISAALYPKVFAEYAHFRNKYGPVTRLPTRAVLASLAIDEEVAFDLRKGKHIYITLAAVSPPSAGKREVFFTLSGEPRMITVTDNNALSAGEVRKTADPTDPGQVGAPLSGAVVDVRVQDGVHVMEGDPLLVLNAMKMEVTVHAPHEGKISTVDVKVGDSVTAGDLLLRISG